MRTEPSHVCFNDSAQFLCNRPVIDVFDAAVDLAVAVSTGGRASRKTLAMLVRPRDSSVSMA